jgi:hypothetical protein
LVLFSILYTPSELGPARVDSCPDTSLHVDTPLLKML